MADFTVVVASGAALEDWLDPPTLDGRPSRLNPRPGYPLKRWVGSRTRPIVLHAVVNGTVAPLDAALGGRLFYAWPVDVPDAALPFGGLSGTPGKSSELTVYAPHIGHYTIALGRPGGGFEHVHLDVG